MRRFISAVIFILLIAPLIIGVSPSIHWGDTPLKTNIPPVIITGESTFKIIESRQIPIPAPFLPGKKERPAITVSSAAEPEIPSGTKLGPRPQSPGCTYQNAITTKVAAIFKGDKAYNQRGQYLFLKQRYDEAIEAFQHLIEEYPNSPHVGDAYFWIGESFFQKDDMQHAYQNFSVTHKSYPMSPYADYAIYSLGWIAFQQKRFHAAVDFFKQGVYGYPNSPVRGPMLFWFGEAYIQIKAYDKAKGILQTFLRENPKSPLRAPALFETGKILFLSKNYKQAIDMAKAVCALSEQKTLIPKARMLVGWSRYFLNDGGAMDAFNKVLASSDATSTVKADALYGKILAALQLKKTEIAEKTLARLWPPKKYPWLGESALALAQYYYEAGLYKKAARVCAKIISDYRRPPTTAYAYEMLGNISYNLKDYSHAAEYYTRVLLGKPRELHASAMYHKGLSFYQLGRFKEAIVSWEILLKRFREFPKYRNVVFWTGSAYLNLRETNKARHYFDTLKQDPELYARGLIQLSHYYFGLQDWQNSLRTLKKFLVSFPRHVFSAKAKGLIGEIYFNLKRYDDAKRWMARALKDKHAFKDKQLRAKLYFTLGQIAYRKQKFIRAAGYFSVVSSKLSRTSFSDQALFWKAMSFYSLQKFREAIHTFITLIKTFPESPHVADAYMKTGDCFYNLKLYGESERYYQLVARKFPAKKIRAKAEYGRLLAFYQSRNFVKFYSGARHFIESFPNSGFVPDTIQLLAEYYEQQGDVEKEIDLLVGFLRKNRKHDRNDAVRMKLARLYIKQGLFTSALVQLRALSRSSPPSPFKGVAEKEMGDIYFRQKFFEEAIKHYRRYLRDKTLPLSVSRHVNTQLIASLLNTGKLKIAAQELKKGLDKYGANWASSLYFELGKIYKRKKKYRNALDAFKKAEKTTEKKNICRAMVAEGQTRILMGQHGVALKTLLLVRYSYPECKTLSEKALLGLAVALGKKGKKDEARQLLKMLKKSHNKTIKKLAQKALNRLH